LKELKEAHAEKDFARMEAASEALTAAWQAASTEMYQAEQGAPGENGAEDPSAGATEEAEVTDVEYEEVDDTK